MLCLCLGCAATVREASKGATTGATQALDQPANRQRILSIVESPEVEAAVRDLAADATSGAVTVITDEKTAEQMRRLIETIARTAVDATLTEMATPENQRRMQQSATAVAESATRASLDIVTEDLPRAVGAAMGQLVRDDVGPGLREMASSPDTRAALSSAVFEVARQSVLGSNEAMAELEKSQPKKGLLARATSVVAEGGALVIALLDPR